MTERRTDVERYANGRIKYEQDQKKKYEAEKKTVKMLSVKIPIVLADDFSTKLANEKANCNAKIRSWIEGYVYEDNPK